MRISRYDLPSEVNDSEHDEIDDKDAEPIQNLYDNSRFSNQS